MPKWPDPLPGRLSLDTPVSGSTSDLITRDELAAVIESFQTNRNELERRVRTIEKQLDTLGSPLWKRVWWRLAGWPPWHVVAARPARRPWRQD